jgi:hypothetical protein
MMPKDDVGSRLVIVANFMNHLCTPIQDSSTQWIIQWKRLANQTIIIFVGQHDYEWSHTNNGILDIEGQRPIKQIMTKHSR